MSSWSGEGELATCLQEFHQLQGNRPSISKINTIVSIALKYITDYKMIVYDVEKWMKKAPIENRLCGIFVIDSICRSMSHKNISQKDIFPNRFVSRFNEIFTLLNGLSEKHMNSFMHVIDEWLKLNVFPKDKILNALKCIKSSYMREPNLNYEVINVEKTIIESTKPSSKVSDPRKKHKSSSSTEDVNVIKTPPESPKKRLLSREEAYVVIGRKKNIKQCPFIDNCPYGEKCKYSHTSEKFYYPTSLKKTNRIDFHIQNNTTLLNDTLAISNGSIDQLKEYYNNKSKASFEMIVGKIPRHNLSTDNTIIELDTSNGPKCGIKFASVLEEYHKVTTN